MSATHQEKRENSNSRKGAKAPSSGELKNLSLRTWRLGEIAFFCHFGLGHECQG
jgi:hypothetical protein